MSEKVPLTELQKLPEWALLTDHQAKFVTEYIKTGDLRAAAKDAYHVQDERQLLRSAAQVMRNPKVASMLDKYAGKSPQSPREIALTCLERKIRKGIVNAAELKLYAQLNGILPRSPSRHDPKKESPKPDEAEPQKFAIGTVIEQAGKKYQVVAQEQK